MANEYVIVGGELYHYGVVGMKWGVRKARKAGSTYTYKSHGQKKWERKLQKAKSKGADAKTVTKANQKLALYKQRDANRQDYAKKTTAGRTIAKGLLMGPFGSGNYNRLRSAGWSRVGSALISNFAVSTLSYPVTYLVSRNAETRLAKRDLEKRGEK